VENQKWNYDPSTRTVTIRENGEYHVGTMEHFIVVKVEVESGSKDVSKEGGSEAQ